MSKENLKVVILGGGESGVGAAILAKTKGLEVFLRIKEKLKRITKRF
jgi:UDP-N-acetylmuramoylalanine--D-glutamate ligase